MAIVGKVHDLTAEFYFEWQIDDFFSLPEKYRNVCLSPPFSFAGDSWYFTLFPYVECKTNSDEYIGVYLSRILDGPTISLAWSLGVKTFEGKTDRVKQNGEEFYESGCGSGFLHFLERSVLSEKKSELVPSDVLTLVCHIEHCSKSKDGAGDTETAECSHCKEYFDAEYILFHEEKCLHRVMRLGVRPRGKVVALRKWFNHAYDAARVKVTKKLVDDLADIFESEEHSDVTFRVKGKEFRLHRSILAGRNPYFSSMFKTEMKEKNTGIVSIDDCEPNIFESFMYFVYTGEVDIFSSNNVCALYEVADKYQEDQLKLECLCYMKNEMSIDSFIDFIVLALKYDEKELLQKATDLFCWKAKEIVRSVKWQTFMREYPTQANELYIKALDFSPKEIGKK